MITKKDISDFFDLEAETAKENWKGLMRLPISKRVRKRKAIQNVFLVKDYNNTSEDNYILLKVTTNVNLSDFKEGECMILHKKETIYGIKCTLVSFEDDKTLIIEVFPPKMPAKLESYYDVALILDKDYVDLRQNIYYSFIGRLPDNKNLFWKSLILNRKPVPDFEEKGKNIIELDETIKNFELTLLPKQKEAIVNCMSARDYYLIQGPPGTGKSFVLGLIMLEELDFFKHKIIVIGPNHMAINNALEQVLKLYPMLCEYFVFKVGQYYNAPKLKVEYKGKEYKIRNVNRIGSVNKLNAIDSPWIIGLTPHSLFSSRAYGLSCDTLIIDEAGQMTIPLALMGMIRAKKILLAGDHKQLAPIVSCNKIRNEMRKSVFEALLTKHNYTQLNVSFRMCETICNFVSDIFYDGKVKPNRKGNSNLIVCEDPIFDFHTPIVIHEVDDQGEQTSDKEAEFVADTIAGFILQGLQGNEVAALSPFKAQAANIRRCLRKHSEIQDEQLKLISSDTIDKMQGQEREVIIYSLVSGDLDYMTEMADFLYNPNKMNVAFSRAKSKLIIVGNIKKIKELSLEDYPHIRKMLKSEYVKYV